MAIATFDVELALMNPLNLPNVLLAQLEDRFNIEDRTHLGWGLVLRLNEENSESLECLLHSFIDNLPIQCVTDIQACQPIFRIAVFNPNVTCTFVVSELAKLGRIAGELEVSIYPTQTEDAAGP